MTTDDHSRNETESPVAEPNSLRVSLRTALILLVFTLFFTALMAGAYRLTGPLLAQSAEAAKLRVISDVLPGERYDNALLNDYILLPPQRALATEAETRVYRARKDGEPAALVVEFAAEDGYSGHIGMILAQRADGTLEAVRVTQHKETPGLGDYIDPKKDRNKRHPWINQFHERSFTTLPAERWRVKKDGGDFDQMAGATISARAVTNATRRTMEWLLPRRERLFALPAESRYDEAPSPETRP